MVACQITDAFSGSDHHPIKTTIQLEAAIQTDLPARRCFKRMKLEAVQAKPHLLQQPSGQLGPHGIDECVDYLVQFIQDLIEQAVPLSQPSEQAQPWWDEAVAGNPS